MSSQILLCRRRGKVILPPLSKWAYRDNLRSQVTLRSPSILYHFSTFGGQSKSTTESMYLQSYYHSLPSDHIGNESTLESLHAKVIKNRLVEKPGVGNYLMRLYVKSHCLESAQKLFDEFSVRDVQAWTILIHGFSQIGSTGVVVSLFKEMQSEGVSPNHYTLSSVLKCCSVENELQVGKVIHAWILCSGIILDVVLENSLLDFYVKCGDYDNASRFFGLMVERDIGSWNIMMNAYFLMGDTKCAMDLFKNMPSRDVSSWNTVINGLMQNGFEMLALELLYQMIRGPCSQKHTFSTALVLVASLSMLELGRQIHCRVLRVGIGDEGYIVSSLIDMYCKCGEVEKAKVIFERLTRDRTTNSKIYRDDPDLEIVSCSSMVSGFVQSGWWEDAFGILRGMVLNGVRVDNFTLTSIISACANAGTLVLGQQIHAYIKKIGQKEDNFLCSSLVDMYAKCGILNDAWSVFGETNDRNPVLWTSMISSCALHGQGRVAVDLFESMILEGVAPNEVTFLGVLTACSHAGLLDEGANYFRIMRKRYGIDPAVEHYICMVDLYGRAGCLKKTKEFIYEHDISRLSSVWRSFLSSCRLHKNTHMAKWVSEKLLKRESLDAGSHVLLSSVCASDGRWEEAAEVWSSMKRKGVKKHAGRSWIQVKNQVHTFVMGDGAHPQSFEIHSYLGQLIGKLKEIGYSPAAELVTKDVGEEQGEILVGLHSEKLAAVFGIISTSSGTPLRIMKNLRICADCHNFMKYVSQLLDREIIVRDIRRFHHFKHGSCSCGDYW